MPKTVVGLLENQQEVQTVVQELTEGGIPRDRIGLMASDRQRGAGGQSKSEASRGDAGDTASGAMKGAGTGAAVGGLAGLALALVPIVIPGVGPFIAAGPIAAALTGAGLGAVAGGVIGGLTKMGVPEEHAHYYAEGVRRGGTLVTVTTDTEAETNRALLIMKRHGAVDIEQRAAGWKREGWAGRFTSEEAGQSRGQTRGQARGAATGDQTIPVVDEELVVGKRETQQGGVRVYSHVIEEPAQASINLREERATVERQRVDRPLSGEQADAFRDRSIEVRETSEEPVVGKRARVVEEVRVGKQQTERQQTVSDKVRKTQVEVERTGAKGGARGWDGADRRRGATAGYRGQERRSAV